MSERATPRRASSRSVVFICYSHRDAIWLDTISRHLLVFESQAIIDRWDDRRISVGTDWRPEINAAIDRCSVGLLVVSNNFLGSQFIKDVEIPRLLARRANGQGRIIPIVVEPCAWSILSWLEACQVFPPNDKALSELRKPRRERLLTTLFQSELLRNVRGAQ